MIDLTICMILSIKDFDQLLLNLNIPLTHEDSVYYLSYLLTNYFIYVFCFMFLIAVYMLMKRILKRNSSLMI